jgi:two-component system LytT family response regulator
MATAGAAVTALIVEDEPLPRRRLRDLMRGVPWITCVGEIADGRAAITAINEFKPDLVFLDIQLPGVSGIDLLARVQHTPSVIFTTAYDQYAVSAFELAAVDYLLKPFGRDRFARAVERVRLMLTQRAGARAVERARETLGSGAVSRLFARDGTRIVPIRLDSVEWLQASDDYVIAHTAAAQFQLHVSLADLERRLDSSVFVRVHRSAVVNMDHVISWTPYDGSRFQITLRTGTKILSSRQRSAMLRDLLR